MQAELPAKCDAKIRKTGSKVSRAPRSVVNMDGCAREEEERAEKLAAGNKHRHRIVPSPEKMGQSTAKKVSLAIRFAPVLPACSHHHSGAGPARLGREAQERGIGFLRQAVCSAATE